MKIKLGGPQQSHNDVLVVPTYESAEQSERNRKHTESHDIVEERQINIQVEPSDVPTHTAIATQSSLKPSAVTLRTQHTGRALWMTLNQKKLLYLSLKWIYISSR